MGKARHRSLEDARLAARLSGRIYGGELLRGYQCDRCGFYHVGHPPGKLKRMLREGYNPSKWDFRK